MAPVHHSLARNKKTATALYYDMKCGYQSDKSYNVEMDMQSSDLQPLWH